MLRIRPGEENWRQHYRYRYIRVASARISLLICDVSIDEDKRGAVTISELPTL